MPNFHVSTFILNNQNIVASFVHPFTNRRIRKTFSSGADADEYKHKVEKKFRPREIASYSDQTVEDLIILFSHEKPESTFFKLKLHLSDFTEVFGHLSVHRLTDEIMGNWLDQIQYENRIKDTTMRSLKCSLDRFFEFLVEKEIISESPLKEIYYKKTSAEKITRRHLTSEETEKLLEALKRYSPGYLYPIIKLFAETGAKVNEIVDLKWGQVNLVKRTVHFPCGERTQTRELPISEELSSLLSSNQKASGFVFKTFYREPFTRAKLTRAINEFKALRVYRGSWNLLDLRYSFGVNFLAKGGSLLELQPLMGHANIFDTKRIFSSPTK